jgi:uncharacterized protein (TIGR02145 family)
MINNKFSFKHIFILAIIIAASIPQFLHAQNVGVGTSTTPARLIVLGPASNPTAPGPSSTGIFRVGVSNNQVEGIDFGKQTSSPFAGWMQVGFNGNASDPLAIQPLGGSVSVGATAPNASAVLDVTSTTKGLLPPRMNKAQRDAIASPAEGLMISCTDCSTKGLHQYINGAWQAMTSSNTGNYGTVVNPVTGKIWLDRNLGATQVATSSTDALSYGHLYQWGRAADGHQIRTSATHNTQATTWLAGGTPWDGKFIIGFGDWLTPAATDLWSGTAAENNPCPSGFRIPTNAEWYQERLTWSTFNAAGAFGSPLKLPMAGIRNFSNGSLSAVGTNGNYWSSTVSGTFALYLSFDSSAANMGGSLRAEGYSVRCLKD